MKSIVVGTKEQHDKTLKQQAAQGFKLLSAGNMGLEPGKVRLTFEHESVINAQHHGEFPGEGA